MNYAFKIEGYSGPMEYQNRSQNLRGVQLKIKIVPYIIFVTIFISFSMFDVKG